MKLDLKIKRVIQTIMDNHGFLIVDKPTGVTSSSVVQQIKTVFRIRKVGHTGTLDPLATGLLVLCVGQATKFSRFVIDQDKSYRVAIRLGVATDTFDSEGKVTSKASAADVSEEMIESALERFRGKIKQVPPMYSAIKKNGVPLYKMARRGLQIDLDAREVTIHENTLLNFDGEILELYVSCSKGTYIRTIAADLGDVLGCGAHVVSLRRLSVGHYVESDMLCLRELELAANKGSFSNYLLPVSSPFKEWAELLLEAEQARLVKNGAKIKHSLTGVLGCVGLYEKCGLGEKRFIGVGEISENGILHPKRLLHGV